MIGFLKRWRWALLLVALLLAGLAYSFWPRAVAVDAGTVDRGPMAVGVTDDGVTRLHDVYAVSAPVTGQVTRIEIEPGDRVVAGQTLIATMAARPSPLLDERTRREVQGALAAARAAESSARANVESADAALKLARSDLARAEALAQKGFVSRARLDALRADAAARRGALAAAQGAVRQAEGESARLRATLGASSAGSAPSSGPVPVRSPVSGVVLRVLRESAGIVAEGEPLVELGDTGHLEIVVDLLSRDAVPVRPGTRALISRWGGPDPLEGRVREVEPYGQLKISALGIEEQRVNVIIDLDRPGRLAAKLGHGYQVDATILYWQADNVLRLPVAALFRSGADWHAYRIVGGRAEKTRLRIGHINEDHAEVLAGLAKGDRVILNPGGTIADGVRVAPRLPAN